MCRLSDRKSKKALVARPSADGFLLDLSEARVGEISPIAAKIARCALLAFLAAGAAIKSKQTITGLLDLWWEEAKATGRTQQTYDTYKGAIDRLVRHLGYDEVGRATDANMLAFKDARLLGSDPNMVKRLISFHMQHPRAHKFPTVSARSGKDL
jgi:hypothetical protein